MSWDAFIGFLRLWGQYVKPITWKQREKKGENLRERERERKREREAKKKRETEREKERDREKEKKRDRERQKKRERERDRDRERKKLIDYFLSLKIFTIYHILFLISSVFISIFASLD